MKMEENVFLMAIFLEIKLMPVQHITIECAKCFCEMCVTFVFSIVCVYLYQELSFLPLTSTSVNF